MAVPAHHVPAAADRFRQARLDPGRPAEQRLVGDVVAEFDLDQHQVGVQLQTLLDDVRRVTGGAVTLPRSVDDPEAEGSRRMIEFPLQNLCVPVLRRDSQAESDGVSQREDSKFAFRRDRVQRRLVPETVGVRDEGDVPEDTLVVPSDTNRQVPVFFSVIARFHRFP